MLLYEMIHSDPQVRLHTTTHKSATPQPPTRHQNRSSLRVGEISGRSGWWAERTPVFSEDVDKVADAAVLAEVTMDEIEAQAISDTKDSATDAKVEVGETKSSEFRDYSLDDSEDEEAFLELYSDEGTEEEQGDDDDVTLSEAEFKLVLDRVNARYNRFVERLRARNKTVLIKDYTAADFVDSDDEEISQVISVTADFKPCGHADDARVAAIQ